MAKGSSFGEYSTGLLSSFISFESALPSLTQGCRPVRAIEVVCYHGRKLRPHDFYDHAFH